MPFLRQCEENYKKGMNIILNNMEIQVYEYQDGKDMTARHIDSKIVLYVNKEKIVIHSYNSTQKVMVSGSKYLEFTENLKSLFMRKIENTKDAILEYDESVKKSLTLSHGPKFATSRSVKSIRSSINQPNFQCTKCDITTKSYATLKKHKLVAHSVSLNASQGNMLYLRHSTRNNSIQDEPLLCDDISLGAISYVTINEKANEETEEPKNQHSLVEHYCNGCNLNFQTDRQLDKHIEDNHERAIKCN